jgi:hypothetical protein
MVACEGNDKPSNSTGEETVHPNRKEIDGVIKEVSLDTRIADYRATPLCNI